MVGLTSGPGAGCAPTYRSLPSEDEIPCLASLKGSAAALPHRSIRVPVRPASGSPIRLAFHETGAGDRGRLVVLLHGVFSDSRLWRFVRGDLGRDHDLVAIDMPGSGGSDRPDPAALGPGGYTPAAMARSVLLALREYLAGRPSAPRLTLAGHSLGGTVILSMFGDPKLRGDFRDVLGAVDSVVLLAPADLAADPDPDTPGPTVFGELTALTDLKVCLAGLLGVLRERAAAAAWEGVTEPGRGLREEADRTIEILRDGPRRRAMQAMILQATPRSRPAIEAIRRGYAATDVPALVLSGDRDDVSPPRRVRALATRLPVAQFQVVPAAKHSLPIERPRTVSRLIRVHQGRISTPRHPRKPGVRPPAKTKIPIIYRCQHGSGHHRGPCLTISTEQSTQAATADETLPMRSRSVVPLDPEDDATGAGPIRLLKKYPLGVTFEPGVIVVSTACRSSPSAESRI